MTKATLKINKFGRLAWLNDKGELHRDDDKPAVILSDGTKQWWVNGELHRDNDKPAVIYPDGYKQWWVNGEWVRSSDD